MTRGGGAQIVGTAMFARLHSSSSPAIYDRRRVGHQMPTVSHTYHANITHPDGSRYSIGIPAQEIPQALLAEIAKLNARVDALESLFEYVEELDWGVALAKARQIFLSSDAPVSPIELADALGTSYSQAIELCEVLEKAGEIVDK